MTEENKELIEGQPLPEVSDNPEFEVGISKPNPPVLEDWDAVNILDIPEDAVNLEGVPIWDIISMGTGLKKDDIKTIQDRYVNSKGQPLPLYMIGVGNFTFIIREVTTKLHREIIQACHVDEREYIKNHTPAEAHAGDDVEIDVPGAERQKWEELNTIKSALVWPPIGQGEGQFDPHDEDLPFLVVSQLFTKILEASGAYDMPLLKKV
jgi:hypothetical protein